MGGHLGISSIADARRLTGQILGVDVGLPFGIAPMGMCNLSWPGGDRALARLAATRQIPLCVSTAASTPLETMIEMSEGHDMVLTFDGGVRRGEDIIKARVAGADFVMVGRPFLYGLGAAGEKRIHRITDILAEEADITMGLIGETELTAIGLQNLAM